MSSLVSVVETPECSRVTDTTEEKLSIEEGSLQTASGAAMKDRYRQPAVQPFLWLHRTQDKSRARSWWSPDVQLPRCPQPNRGFVVAQSEIRREIWWCFAGVRNCTLQSTACCSRLYVDGCCASFIKNNNRAGTLLCAGLLVDSYTTTCSKHFFFCRRVSSSHLSQQWLFIPLNLMDEGRAYDCCRRWLWQSKVHWINGKM